MQYLYDTEDRPEAYVDGAGYIPAAPKRCPHKGCHMPVELKKHGYYKRYLILGGFAGYIRIRRYICPVCGKTVSMLPSFCIPGFQYGADVVICMTRRAYQCGSVSRAAREWSGYLPEISRRHLTYYLSRLRANRILLQYGLNGMSPAFIRLGTIAEDKSWTKSFLDEIRFLKPSRFNADFHQITGSSFMSLHNMVA
jgi:hypothetical protein